MSILNTQLTTSTAITAGGLIPIGNIVHKCGSGLNAGGNTIRINGSGYVKITASITVEPTAIADMIATLYENGSPIASASGAPAVAGDPVNLNLIGLIYNKCGCNLDQITIGLNSAGSVTEMDVIVEAV